MTSLALLQQLAPPELPGTVVMVLGLAMFSLLLLILITIMFYLRSVLRGMHAIRVSLLVEHNMLVKKYCDDKGIPVSQLPTRNARGELITG